MSGAASARCSPSTKLLAQLTERSAETGEHYITRTPAEQRRHSRAVGRQRGLPAPRWASLRSLGLTAFWAASGRCMLYALSFALASAALDRGHQAAGDDGAGPGHAAAATSRAASRVLTTYSDGLCGRSGPPFRSAGGRHRRQCGGRGAPGAAGPGPGALAAGSTAHQRRPGALPCCIRSDHCSARPCCLRRSPAVAVRVQPGRGLGGELVSSSNRLDSAIAWNPRIVAVLGAARAGAGPPGGGPISRA